MSLKQAEILGVNVNSLTMVQAVEKVQQFIDERKNALVATANAEMLMRATQDEELKHILNSADLVVPDGAGTVWAANYLGVEMPERVAGYDLAQEPCGQASIVVDKNNKLLASAAFPLHYFTEENILTFDTISAMLSKASDLVGSYQVPDQDRFKKLVKNELHRAQNKVQKLKDDIAAADNAEDYRIKADNLMTYQYQFKDRQDAEIKVPNIYDEAGCEITIVMDQRLSIVENIQAYYKK